MGYTHYWELNAKGNDEAFQQAKKQIIEFLKTRKDLADGGGEKGTKPITKDIISFNGIDKNSHETFWLPKTLAHGATPEGGKTADNKGYYFNFCKTNMKPYDTVVVACLTILKLHLLKDIKVNSDGNAEDLKEGVVLACSFLKEQGFLNNDNNYYPNKEIEQSVFFIKELKEDI